MADPDEIDLVDEIYRVKPGALAPIGSVPDAPDEEPVWGEPPIAEPVGPAGERSFVAAVAGVPETPVPAVDAIPETPVPAVAPVAWVPIASVPIAAVAPAAVAPRPRRRLRVRIARFGLAFAVGVAVSAALLSVAAFAIAGAYSNRVAPGVHVGSVDVSGLTRDQMIGQLQAAYAYLDEGEVKVTTPTGVASISYKQAGRQPDVGLMADAAMKIGHTGYPIADASYIIRSAIQGQSLPIVVRVDPVAVASLVHKLVAANQLAAVDAQVTVQGGGFGIAPATKGSVIDEAAISAAIVDNLTNASTSASFQAGGAFLALDPQVSDQDAQNAIAAAERMTVPVQLTWGGAAGAQASSPTPIPAKTFTIDAQTVRSWILFGHKTDGSYGPVVDPTPIQAYVSALSPKVEVQPVEARVVYDSSGKPSSLTAGKDGIGIDVPTTSQAIVAYLNSLAKGGAPGAGIAIAAAAVSPRVTVDTLSSMVMIGSWTTIFYPDISNGNGANIRTPAKLLNGLVIAPGQQFSFLKSVSPVDPAHGYTLGGVIEGGKSNHTGAMGGGICSASTTMFNAAARAGLQIDERHAHFYYIYRYPTGLDATVFSDGWQVWDLKWTNDTPNPIVIRGFTTYGSASTVTFQLWSLPLNRTVKFSPEYKANLIQPGDHTVYVTTLKPGQKNRAEYPTIGFDTSRTRTVTDSSGNVIHVDTWNSHYTKVDGILQIGRAKTKPPGPTPTPGAPAITGAVAPADVPAPSATAN